MTELDDWLTRIGEVHPVKWDLGLQRVASVAQEMDLVHPAKQVVLVAGTNGKGSTVEFLARFARAAGLSVGKSTSPHLHHFNERIVVNDVASSDELIVDAFRHIDHARGSTTLTYFEFATLASLYIFSKLSLDLAILEIGLGGRLDAMNIVDPDLSIITSISLDHEAWLGNSREAIAFEKAGIMRSSVPCIVSDWAPPATLLTHAFNLNVPLDLIGEAFEAYRGVELGLPVDSFAAAKQAVLRLGIQLDSDELYRQARSTLLPGRRTWVNSKCRVLLDIAHNPAAAESLAQYVLSLGEKNKIHAVVGMYADKNIELVIRPFLDRINTWHCVDMDEPRAELAENIALRAGIRNHAEATTYVNIELALDVLLAKVDEADLVLVFGSFPIVAGALRALK